MKKNRSQLSTSWALTGRVWVFLIGVSKCSPASVCSFHIPHSSQSCDFNFFFGAVTRNDPKKTARPYDRKNLSIWGPRYIYYTTSVHLGQFWCRTGGVDGSWSLSQETEFCCMPTWRIHSRKPECTSNIYPLERKNTFQKFSGVYIFWKLEVKPQLLVKLMCISLNLSYPLLGFFRYALALAHFDWSNGTFRWFRT